jgi:hypothetical protein
MYQKKTAEEEAAAAVKITGWKLQNKSTGEVIELKNEEYMQNLAKYPKTEWSVVEQIKSKPAIEATKLSDFSITSPDGFDVAEDILTDSGHVFLIVAYKLKGESRTEQTMVPDTSWVSDTVMVNKDSMAVTRRLGEIGTRKVSQEIFVWEEGYIRDYTEKVNVLMVDVMKQGAKVYAAAGGAGGEKLESFRKAIGSSYDWYEADDILLKTIIRSNPGVVHIHAGKVVEMWHIRQLPKSVPLN